MAYFQTVRLNERVQLRSWRCQTMSCLLVMVILTISQILVLRNIVEQILNIIMAEWLQYSHLSRKFRFRMQVFYDELSYIVFSLKKPLVFLAQMKVVNEEIYSSLMTWILTPNTINRQQEWILNITTCLILLPALFHQQPL